MASVDDIESLCLILSGNLKEKHSSVGGKGRLVAMTYIVQNADDVKFDEVQLTTKAVVSPTMLSCPNFCVGGTIVVEWDAGCPPSNSLCMHAHSHESMQW